MFSALLEQVPARERPFAHELTYGTLRLRGRLDALLAPHVRRGLERVQPELLDVLRLGAYQLLEMGSVPAYAAVSQAVEQAKQIGGRGAGSFVNGVLQALRRAGPAEPWPSLDERTAALVAANNTRPALYLRPVGVPVTVASERLEEAGIAHQRPALGGFGPGVIAPDVLELLPPASVAEALAAVPAVVQDPAASLVTRVVAAAPGSLVADLCAAPGGKTVGIAGDVPDARVLAADATPERLVRLRENVLRVSRTSGPLRRTRVDRHSRGRTSCSSMHPARAQAPCAGIPTDAGG